MIDRIIIFTLINVILGAKSNFSCFYCEKCVYPNTGYARCPERYDRCYTGYRNNNIFRGCASRKCIPIGLTVDDEYSLLECCYEPFCNDWNLSFSGKGFPKEIVDSFMADFYESTQIRKLQPYHQRPYLPYYNGRKRTEKETTVNVYRAKNETKNLTETTSAPTTQSIRHKFTATESYNKPESTYTQQPMSMTAQIQIQRTTMQTVKRTTTVNNTQTTDGSTERYTNKFNEEYQQKETNDDFQTTKMVSHIETTTPSVTEFIYKAHSSQVETTSTVTQIEYARTSESELNLAELNITEVNTENSVLFENNDGEDDDVEKNAHEAKSMGLRSEWKLLPRTDRKEVGDGGPDVAPKNSFYLTTIIVSFLIFCLN